MTALGLPKSVESEEDSIDWALGPGLCLLFYLATSLPLHALFLGLV